MISTQQITSPTTVNHNLNTDQVFIKVFIGGQLLQDSEYRVSILDLNNIDVHFYGYGGEEATIAVESLT